MERALCHTNFPLSHLTRKEKEYLSDGSTDGNIKLDRVEPGYNDSGLSETSSIGLNILWFQLIPHSYS
jgi:hypothetical protein